MIYRFGHYTLDPAGLELRRGGQLVYVEPQVFHLLLHLIAHRDRVVGKDELLETVWEGRVVSDATLNTRINAVRRAVGDNGKAQKVVRTFPRRGFRFVGQVTEENKGSPDPGRPVEAASPVSGDQKGSADVGEPVVLDPPKHRRHEAVAGERRHLTAMVSELVLPADLSVQLDPEAFADAIIAYQNAIRPIIADFEGFVASARGPMILVYFGYPQAHEDDAERSVRAALRVVDTIRNINMGGGTDWTVKVGIATGTVVAGDIVGGAEPADHLVLGRTPDLAAGLQAFAEPDSIVMADNTRRLVEGMFVWDDLGPIQIRNLDTVVEAYRVYGESDAPSRFEAGAERWLTPLIGREEEIGLFLKRWEQAKEGEGQLVLLSGDAGLGKSRIVRDLKSRLANELQSHLFFYCSPHHRNSSLYPCVDALERFLGFEKCDDPRHKLDKLERRLDNLGLSASDLASYLAVLLSLLPDEHDPGPEEIKRKTLEALTAVIEAVAARTPEFIVVEDTHWIDPTTLEFLDLLVERLRSAHILLVITFRPDFEPPWTEHAHSTTLALNRLSRRESKAMVDKLIGGKALPDKVLDEIINKSDGVPLFVEELVKTVLESDLVSQDGDRYVPLYPRQALAIPTSLQDSLMARLDRLGPAKSVAQLASVLGRTFRHELLAEVFSGAGDDLEAAVFKLTRAGLLYRRGLPPDATYDFKHALLQEAAYQSLVKRTRQKYHERIARILETRFPDSVETEPEILAHHYTEAGNTEKAIPLWHHAGRRAAKRSALVEANEHLQKALSLLSELQQGRDREMQELETLILLGPILMGRQSSASPEIGEVYRRARELCDRVGDPAQRLPVLWGLWLHNHMAGEMEAALDLAHEAIEFGESQADEGLLLQAHHAAWASQMELANFSAAVEHAEHGLSLYNPERHRLHAFTYGGHDPGVCACTQSAIAGWLLGYPDQAVERCQQALDLADNSEHPSSKAQALSSNAQLYLLRREPEKALDFADELLVFSTDNELHVWHANGKILRSWAVSEMGDPARVLHDLRDGIRQRQNAGAQLRLSLHLAVLADVLARTGNVDQSEGVIAQALDELEATRLRAWEPFVYWIRGRIVAVSDLADTAKSEASYQKSFEISRRLDAKSMSLRAALSLATLWFEQGRRVDARDFLAPVYSSFTEGFDTPDLEDARSLLDRTGYRPISGSQDK